MPVAVLEPRRASAQKRVSRFAESNAAALAAGTPLEVYAHPKDFNEFYAKEPHLIRNWLRFRRCPQDLIEDYTQDLLMFLMRPVTDKENVVYVDHISYYQPEKMGGYGTRPAFIKFVFDMLQREYPKAIRRFKKAHTSGPNIMSLNRDDFADGNSRIKIPVDAPGELSVTLTPLLTAEDVAKFRASDEAVDPKIIVSSFFTYLQAHAEPEVLVFARACMIYDTLVDITRAMGFTRSQCRSLTASMRFWGKQFRAGKH